MLTNGKLLAAAIHVVDHYPLGILATSGADESPHARWLLAVAVNNLSHVYCLTGRESRKISQLRANPGVCWVFTSPSHDEVVTLTGQARILNSLNEANIAWDRMIDAAHNYTVNALTGTKDQAFCAVETVVERAEIISPRLGIYLPHVIRVSHESATIV